MTRDHADFYVGTGPSTRWLGSLADVGSPVELARPGAAGDAETTAVLSATDRNGYEVAVAALLIRQRAAEVGFVGVPGPDGKAGWPWLATTSSGWYAYTFVDGQVRVSAHGGPWFRPDPRRPDGGAESATGPDADLPVFGDTTPKTATFTWTGFRGLPIPIRATLPPVPPAYLAHPRRGRPHRGRRRGVRPGPAVASGRTRRPGDPRDHARCAAARPRSWPCTCCPPMRRSRMNAW